MGSKWKLIKSLVLVVSIAALKFMAYVAYNWLLMV